MKSIFQTPSQEREEKVMKWALIIIGMYFGSRIIIEPLIKIIWKN
jgi:hypothetical protein